MNSCTCESLIGDLLGRRHKDVLLVVGCAISCSRESRCAGVNDIRDAILLDWLSSTSAEAKKLIQRLSPLFKKLPFEQFMNCVHAVLPNEAESIIRMTCGGNGNSHPNTNHEYVVRIAERLLQQGLCESVTILTTNYDTCLEQVAPLCQCSLERKTNSSIYTAQVQVAGGSLKYMKVHGCITDPASCVFTMNHLAQSLVPQRSTFLVDQLGQPTLLLFICYSFSDPDLRSVFRSLIGPNAKASVQAYWNDLESRPGPPTNSGPAWLRQEFLQEHELIMHYGDLFRPAQHHLLNELGASLGIEAMQPPEWKSCTEEVKHAAMNALGEISGDGAKRNAALILSRLADACCSPAANKLLKPLVFSQQKPDFSAVQLYLHQFGQARDYTGMLDACRRIRKHHRDPDIQALCWSRESFALSITGRMALLPRAFWSLGWGFFKQLFATPVTKAVYRQYAWHLVAKCIQKSAYMSPRVVLLSGGASLLRFAAKRVARNCERRAESLERGIVKGNRSETGTLSLVDVAGDRLLAGQMFILANDADSAKRNLDLADRFFSTHGWLNGALQANRAQGWLHYQQGEQLRAERVLALGLWRATETVDTTLRPKLGADLLRVLWKAHRLESATSDLQEVIPSKTLTDCLAPIATGDAKGFSRDACMAVLSEVKRLYKTKTQWEVLLRHIEDHVKPSLYPVFLPPDPKPEDCFESEDDPEPCGGDPATCG